MSALFFPSDDALPPLRLRHPSSSLRRRGECDARWLRHRSCKTARAEPLVLGEAADESRRGPRAIWIGRCLVVA